MLMQLLRKTDRTRFLPAWPPVRRILKDSRPCRKKDDLSSPALFLLSIRQTLVRRGFREA